MSDVILEQDNPYGTITAVIEEDGRSAYLYLFGLHLPDFKPRALWLRNLIAAPLGSDSFAKEKGIAPLLSTESCQKSTPSASLKESELELVWFQEGNAVALYVDGELEAVIPPWSTRDGFFGFTRLARAAEHGYLPFPAADSPLFDRIEENRNFWQLRGDGNYWATFRDALLERYRCCYGPESNYFALQERRYPPIGVAEWLHDDGSAHYATVGMSFQNLPNVEMISRNPEAEARIEVILPYPRHEEWLPGLVARMAIYPWLRNIPLRHAESFESGLSEERSSFLLTSRFLPDSVEPPAEHHFEGFRLLPLQAIAITQEELLMTRALGGEKLLAEYESGERARS